MKTIPNSNHKHPLMRRDLPLFILLFTIAISVAVGCDDGGSGTDPDPGNSKIADEDIRGTWIKVSDNFGKDTAVFTEQRLEAPAVSAVNGGYIVDNGQIILAGEVMAEYEIADDTLYIEALIAIEPDGNIDRESATKYVQLTADPADTDTSDTNSTVTTGGMDPRGQNIPVGLACDTFTMGLQEYADQPHP